MANHGFAEPTANFTYDGAVEPGVFRLQAMRKMSAGEEVGSAEVHTHLFFFADDIIPQSNKHIGEMSR